MSRDDVVPPKPDHPRRDPVPASGDGDGADGGWAESWIASVTATSMTQRKLTTVERNGGLAALTRAATARGVHLLLLTDDKGDKLVAASRHPFEILC